MNYSINVLHRESPAHKHNNYEIIIYTKGSGILYTAGKETIVGPGKIVIIPPGNVHHSLPASDNFERIYVSGPLNRFFSLSSTTIVLDNPANEGLLLAKMIYNNRYSEEEYLEALINAFSHFLLQNIKMEEHIFLAVKNIIEQISKNFFDCNIDVNDLLEKSGYSKDYIRAQFKNITKKTPIEFLTKIRIDHACYLINLYKNSFSLADIAEKCGYSDYVYFSRKFKQIMGVSPKKYMNEN